MSQRYRLLEGPFQQVHVHHDPARQFVLDAPTRQAVTVACESLRREGRRVEQNPLHLCVGWKGGPGGLVLETGLVDYECFLGLQQLGRPAPVVLCVAAATEVEGCLVLQERSSQVALGAGLLHVAPSGHVHPGPRGPWETVLAEAKEELGLDPEELLDPLCLGLVESLMAPVLAVIYRMSTPVTWESLLRRQPVDSWEHLRLLPLPLQPAPLADWLVESDSRVTGPAHAAVLLEGQRRFGPEWRRSVDQRLSCRAYLP